MKNTAKPATLPNFTQLCELAKTKPAELIAHAKKAVSLDAAVEKAAQAFDGCKKFAAKVLAAMKITHENAKATSQIAPDMSFNEYHEQVTGGKPNTHILAMATCFNRLVETGHIEEKVFDAQPNDAIEKANECITAIIEKYKGSGTDPKTTPEFKSVVEALNSPGDAAKTLKDLKAEVKPSKRGKKDKDEPEGDEPFVVRVSKLTPEIALQLFGRIVADGQLAMCLRVIPDEMAKLTPEARRSVLLALDDTMADIWKHHAAEMEAVVSARDAQRAPVQVLAGGTPAVNTPGTPTPEAVAA